MRQKKKNTKKNHWVCFVLVINCWAWGLLLSVVWIPSEVHWRKLISVFVVEAGARTCECRCLQERGLTESQQPQLQEVISSPSRVLGTKPGFSRREVHALNYGPISLTTEVISSHAEMKLQANSKLICLLVSSDAYDEAMGGILWRTKSLCECQ